MNDLYFRYTIDPNTGVSEQPLRKPHTPVLQRVKQCFDTAADWLTDRSIDMVSKERKKYEETRSGIDE